MASQAEIAAHLDLSERRVAEILKRLSLPTRGCDIDLARIEYIRSLRGAASGRGDTADKENVVSLTEERTRLTKQQADHEELKVAEKQGDLVPALMAAEIIQEIITSIRAKVLGIPNKLAHQVTGLTEMAEVKQILEIGTREVLQEMHSVGLETLAASCAARSTSSDTGGIEAAADSDN